MVSSRRDCLRLLGLIVAWLDRSVASSIIRVHKPLAHQSQASTRDPDVPSVRLILTEQCGTFDLMSLAFARHVRGTLGEIPITVLRACSKNQNQADQLERWAMRQHYKDLGVDQYHEYPPEQDFRKNAMHYTRQYQYTARPYSILKYFREHLPKEDVIVLAEYDWIWLNSTIFWDTVKKVAPKKPVGVTYSYLQGGLGKPETIAPMNSTRASLSRKALDSKSELLKPVGVPIFIERNDLWRIAHRWLWFTDDILTSEEAAGMKQYDRVTEMYSYLLAAAEAGLNHTVLQESIMFSPGYDTKDSSKVLFGHYAYAFHLCEKNFTKLQLFGSTRNACESLVAPPSPKDLMECSYGETYWKSYELQPRKGGVLARQMALQMWQNTYSAASEICKVLDTGGLIDLARPQEADSVRIHYPPSIEERMDFPKRFSYWMGNCLQEAAFGRDGPCQQPRSRDSSLAQGADVKSTKIDAGVEVFTFLQQCNSMIRPLSDFDKTSGHGNRTCRYRPPKRELLKFRKRNEDIAILVPFLRSSGPMPDDPGKLDNNSMADLGADSWRTYARFHNYSFYTGAPNADDILCAGLEHRAPHWMKPCMARQLLKRHKYLLIVDTDTFVSRPRLRLEPLFQQAGLLKEGGKTIAVADEWGSCWGGRRAVIGGGSNTGVVLLKRSPSAEAALEQWWKQPMDCVLKDKSLQELRQVKLRRTSWTKWVGYGLIEGNWLEHDPNPERCKLLVSSLRGWAYDQLGFWLSIASNPAFEDIVHKFSSGCPVNGPWADFIPHMPSGTVAEEYFDPRDRVAIMQGAHQCISDALKISPDAKVSTHKNALYKRCAICNMLPKKRGTENSWRYSCPASWQAASVATVIASDGHQSHAEA